ncbi:hypothetical protein FVEN_g5644 [Fusarium venenatum]|nr:hypothetical protein FVEN_g5644 [Fusarium venenatum]
MSEDLEKCADSQCIQHTTANAPTVDGDQKLDPVSGQEQLQHQDRDIERNAPPAQTKGILSTTVMKVEVGWHALVFMYWLISLVTIVVMARVYWEVFTMECKN